jgi:hypothetical protein
MLVVADDARSERTRAQVNNTFASLGAARVAPVLALQPTYWQAKYSSGGNCREAGMRAAKQGGLAF